MSQGDVVFAQGDPAREFFVLVNGRVVVTVKGGDPEGPPIAVLTGPTWFGDLAIVSEQARISTVIAETDCEFWVLARTHFEAFFNRHPRMARNLAAALVRRLQEKDQDFTSQSTLALERARLLEELRQGADELAALTDVTRAINVSLDLDQTLGSISTYAARLTKSDSALIFLYNERRGDVLSRSRVIQRAGRLSCRSRRAPPSTLRDAGGLAQLLVDRPRRRRARPGADLRTSRPLPLYRSRELLLAMGVPCGSCGAPPPRRPGHRRHERPAPTPGRIRKARGGTGHDVCRAFGHRPGARPPLPGGTGTEPRAPGGFGLPDGDQRVPEGHRPDHLRAYNRRWIPWPNTPPGCAGRRVV